MGALASRPTLKQNTRQDEKKEVEMERKKLKEEEILKKRAFKRVDLISKDKEKAPDEKPSKIDFQKMSQIFASFVQSANTVPKGISIQNDYCDYRVIFPYDGKEFSASVWTKEMVHKGQIKRYLDIQIDTDIILSRTLFSFAMKKSEEKSEEKSEHKKKDKKKKLPPYEPISFVISNLILMKKITQI